jgi:hypothetical protein
MTILRDPRQDDAPGTLRRLLLALVFLGIVGLLLELVLLEHTESATQWIPLGVLGGGLIAAIALALRPSHGTVRAFQTLMALFVAAGLLGLVLHYRSNVEFELEIDATAAGWELVWRSLRGATPSLAPGAMAQLGLLGLILTYRHPALHSAQLPSTAPGQETA